MNMPAKIYVFSIDGKRIWTEEKVISDSTPYYRGKEPKKPESLGDFRSLLVMVQQETVSVGKAMETVEKWLDGGGFDLPEIAEDSE